MGCEGRKGIEAGRRYVRRHLPEEMFALSTEVHVGVNLREVDFRKM